MIDQDDAVLPFILEPAELDTHIHDDNLLIVDLCKEETRQRGHIPGAVYVDPVEIVSGAKPATGKLPDKDRLTALFARLGYSQSLHIVAYDDEGGGWAGRFIWTLDMIGHQSCSLLNGGLVAWVGEGYPLESTMNTVPPADIEIEIHDRPRAGKQDVLASLDDPDTVIWDARSAEEYAGVRKAADRAGHIPGAINLDWLETMDRNNYLRIRSDIGQVLEARGITRDKTIITHCQTHHRSGLTYVIGKSLGYDIRGYDGSWSEWGNDPDMPVETG